MSHQAYLEEEEYHNSPYPHNNTKKNIEAGGKRCEKETVSTNAT
jgi:hypothetical protein